MQITTMFQLLLIGIQATVNNAQTSSWIANLVILKCNICYYFINYENDLITEKEFQSAMKNTLDHITSTLEPTFKHCTSNVKSNQGYSGFEFIDNFFIEDFTADKIIAAIKKNPSYITEKGYFCRRDIYVLTVYDEIFNILLSNKAIPTVETDGKKSISLNVMINWLFYSIRILVGEDAFNGSEKLVEFVNDLIKMRLEVNNLLKKCKDSSADKQVIKDEARFIAIKLVDLIVLKKLENILNEIKFEGINIDDQRERYLKVYCLMEIVYDMFNCMTEYVRLELFKTEEDMGRLVGEYNSITTDYEKLVCQLVVLSLPFDKAEKIFTGVKNVDTKFYSYHFTPLNEDFTIVDSERFKNEKYQENYIFELAAAPQTNTPLASDSTKIPETPLASHITPVPGSTTGTGNQAKTSEGWGIGSVILAVTIVLLVLLAGGLGIYYLTRGSKAVSEV